MGFLNKVGNFISATSEFTNAALLTLTSNEILGELLKPFQNKLKILITQKLKKVVIKNIVTLLIFICALFISYFEFPTKIISNYITSIILLFIMVSGVVRTIKLIVKNFKFIVCLVQCRFKLFDTIVLYVSRTKGTGATIAVNGTP